MNKILLSNYDIPEGYSYTRCDQYTPEQFSERFTDNNGKVCLDCRQYMTEYNKSIYNTDDEIAVIHMGVERDVNSMYTLTGRNTTKRYKYNEV